MVASIVYPRPKLTAAGRRIPRHRPAALIASSPGEGAAIFRLAERADETLSVAMPGDEEAPAKAPPPLAKHQMLAAGPRTSKP
jgi:hypothetical protein